MNMYGFYNKYSEDKNIYRILEYIVFCRKKEMNYSRCITRQGTTAHVVMQLNAEDNGNRKFILVQIPEKTDEKSETFKAGYKKNF